MTISRGETLSDEPPKIDWERVKNIRLHLEDWMRDNNYELVDIERACSYSRSPFNVPSSGGKD